ncbi:nuclear pore assembly and biogenesis-domain-containing protein [Thermoascus aurantiacus ATCC 26904]
MEYLQEYILPLIPNNSNHDFSSNYRTLLASLASTSTSLSSHLLHLRTAFVDPYVVRPLSALLASSSTPDLVSVLLLALILLVSLKILDYARRVIVFWVTLVLRLLFWGVVLGAGWYVYRVGWEKAARDAAWLWGVAEGFVEDFNQRRGGQGGFGGRMYDYHNSRGRQHAAGGEGLVIWSVTLEVASMGVFG